ncbi:MAG: transcriptional regulator, partial [Gammaproteobacteria bacterium]|nr:transcriptional regulator [Gammaproteobacteria bacterium]
LVTREQQAKLHSFATCYILHAEKLSLFGSGLTHLSLDKLKHYLSSKLADAEMPIRNEEWKTCLRNLGS